MNCLAQRVVLAAALIALSPLACDFSPTAPFAGFDGQGSRISGIFSSGNGGGANLTALPQSQYEGIRVYVKQDNTISTFVKSNGSFTLAGLPAGDVTLVFEKEGSVIGRLKFQDIVPNQELRIVVRLNDSGRVELVEVDRDDVGLGECARGAGFWCENKNGQNPNLSAEDYKDFLGGAEEELDSAMTAAEIDAAVCNTSDQLRRHLATLALNIAAGLVSSGTELVGESFNTVGDALAEAIALLDSGDRSGRNMMKDVLERINENRNTATDCSTTEDDDDGDDDDDDPPTGASCSNVEIPRGAFPPPGECKIWDPRLPAGQQGPPGNCSELCGRKPSGTCVIDHDGNVVC